VLVRDFPDRWVAYWIGTTLILGTVYLMIVTATFAVIGVMTLTALYGLIYVIARFSCWLGDWCARWGCNYVWDLPKALRRQRDFPRAKIKREREREREREFWYFLGQPRAPTHFDTIEKRCYDRPVRRDGAHVRVGTPVPLAGTFEVSGQRVTRG
jgi:hypothetical protein